MMSPSTIKHAEEALRKSEANLRAIFNHIEYAVLLLDPGFKILSFNDIAQLWGNSVFGIKLSEGGNLLSLISEKLQIEDCDLLNGIKVDNSFDKEISYTGIDGANE